MALGDTLAPQYKVLYQDKLRGQHGGNLVKMGEKLQEEVQKSTATMATWERPVGTEAGARAGTGKGPHRGHGELTQGSVSKPAARTSTGRARAHGEGRCPLPALATEHPGGHALGPAWL